MNEAIHIRLIRLHKDLNSEVAKSVKTFYDCKAFV